MAKSKIDKDDIKRLVENTSNPSSTTSVYSAKYIEENFLKEITKAMVEAVLTGVITSHEHNYTALSQALVGFAATSGSITSSDTILSAINKLAYDKHIHSNIAILDAIEEAFTTTLRNKVLGIDTTNKENVNYGNNSLINPTYGNQNVALGYYSLRIDSTGSQNSSVGYSSLYSNTSGHYNSAVGSETLYSNTTGQQNSAIGYSALYFNSSGGSNSAVGSFALYKNNTGYSNSAVGRNSLYSNTSGLLNSAIGCDSGRYITNGSENQTSNKSVFLGYDTRAKQANGTNEIVIGSEAIGNGSNTVTLGNDSITDTYLKGNVHGNVNRTIKVDGVDKAGSATTIPLNFVSTDGVSVYGDVNQGILDIEFSSNSLPFMGELADSITPSTPSFQYDNLLNGIYDIVSENTYYKVPNEVCGTDTSKSGMKGTLIVQFNSVGKSLIYHCFNTNNIYISSGTIDEVDGHIIWSTWKRLLTCEDKPQTIQADIEEESIYHLPIPATGTTDYTFYLNGFDGKNGNKIQIDLSTITGTVNMNKRVVEIYISPAQPNIDVSFYCAGYTFYPTASYINPLSISGNIYYMKFIFLKQTTYWSVDNNIAYF